MPRADYYIFITTPFKTFWVGSEYHISIKSSIESSSLLPKQSAAGLRSRFFKVLNASEFFCENPSAIFLPRP